MSRTSAALPAHALSFRAPRARFAPGSTRTRLRWLAALALALSAAACGEEAGRDDAPDATEGRRDTGGGGTDTTPRPEPDTDPTPDDATDAQPDEDASPDGADVPDGPDATPDDVVAPDADAADPDATDGGPVDADDTSAPDTDTGGTDTGDTDTGGGDGPTCAEVAPTCTVAQRCAAVAGTGPTCVAIRVLVLEESSNTTLVDELTRQGFAVTRGPTFGTWDGLDPELAGHDVLFWQQGTAWTQTMDSAVQATVANWVAAGGGLVRTEWSIYNYTTFSGPADAILPMESTDNTYTYGATWERAIAGHPIGASLTPPYTWDDRGYTFFTPSPAAEVVWRATDGTPLVTTTRSFGGPVVHVNHDLHYDTEPLTPAEVTLFVDAVAWAGVNAW